MQGKVEICGVNTSKLAVLDSATTRRLLLRVRQGDKSAREELIAGNLRLVLSVIQRFSSRGENIDDLFQVGCIGLIKAIDNFDAEAHDVRFSTYGVPMIAGEIRRYLRDNSALRVSRSMRDTAYKILQAREKLTAETGREPTEEEIAAALGIPRQEIALAAEQPEKPRRARHDERQHPPRCEIEDRVAHKAETRAVGNVDDFAVTQLGKPYLHDVPPP